MLKCPRCGFRNLDQRASCLKCGTALLPLDAKSLKNTARKSSAFHPGSILARLVPLAFLARWARRLARTLQPPMPEHLSHRFPFLAGILGLIPGAGQLYNHQPRKIFYFQIPFWIFFILAWQYIRIPWWGNICIAVVTTLCLWSFFDAFLVATRINGQFIPRRYFFALFTYPFFLFGLISFAFALSAWLNFPIITLFSIRSDYMNPALCKGERICNEGVTYWFRKPRPGDVVHYNPPGYKIEIPGAVSSTVYLINPQNGWERVMAVGGETLECRDGKYFVDGRPLSESYYPLLQHPGMFQNFTITCPPDEYIILITKVAEDDGLISLLKSGGVTKAPELNSGYPVVGWEEACTVGKYEMEAGLRRMSIFDRAWFVYHPSEKRRFLQAQGPRFAN